MKKGNRQKAIGIRAEEIDLLKSQLARALADYDNLQKRVERERSEFLKIVNLRLILRLLSILDMLQDAAVHASDPGLAIIEKEFRDVIREEGVEPINLAVGDKFDENLAEVIEVLETGTQDEDNTIAQVSQTGWQNMDGQVLRHAKVKVKKYKGKEKPS